VTPPPTVSSWKVELPFPAKVLWPNGRGHWSAKSRAFKAHKDWACVALMAARGLSREKPTSRVDWSVTIHPKTRNVIDRDNAHASLKAYADGIAQALGVDDKLFNTPSLTFGEPVKGGLVRIEIAS